MSSTGQADDKKRQLVQQLVHLDASYNGGLAAYITNAKQLLQDSRAGATHGLCNSRTAFLASQHATRNCAWKYACFTGKNPFEGYIPEVPDGERMDFGSESFVGNEREGVHTQLLACHPATLDCPCKAVYCSHNVLMPLLICLTVCTVPPSCVCTAVICRFATCVCILGNLRMSPSLSTLGLVEGEACICKNGMQV